MIYQAKKIEQETLILYLESGPQGDHFYRGCSTMGEGARCVDRTEGTMVRKSLVGFSQSSCGVCVGWY